jgi:hypothetical protein
VLRCPATFAEFRKTASVSPAHCGALRGRLAERRIGSRTSTLEGDQLRVVALAVMMLAALDQPAAPPV